MHCIIDTYCVRDSSRCFELVPGMRLWPLKRGHVLNTEPCYAMPANNGRLNVFENGEEIRREVRTVLLSYRDPEELGSLVQQQSGKASLHPGVSIVIVSRL
jgi:hypothetical protein